MEKEGKEDEEDGKEDEEDGKEDVEDGKEDEEDAEQGKFRNRSKTNASVRYAREKRNNLIKSVRPTNRQTDKSTDRPPDRL